MKDIICDFSQKSGFIAYNKIRRIFMKVRINTNSLKNAMGTVFLLAAAFFVCSTFISIRSVFADPIATTNTTVQQSGRQSPRSTSRTSNRTISRATVSRAVAPVATSKSVTSRGTQSRSVTQRSVAQNNVKTASRNVVSRNNIRQNRAIRARSTGSSRVAATGTVMSGNRASVVSTNGTNYAYLSSKLYSGNLSSIVDSSTGLISADAYSTCLESYYTCMDEICTARSDTKGRCSCAGRALSFLQAEEQLEAANEELIKLSGQLSLLISTKGKGDALSSAFSLTDAEKVMNCVSWKDAKTVAGTTRDSNGNIISASVYMDEWCKSHMMYDDSECGTTPPSYCSKSGNDFNFDVSQIDGSSSDIIAQLKAWADAKDLAKQYTTDDSNSLIKSFATISSIVKDSTITINATTPKAELDSLANKWGYKLFEYAHNNVCGRVLDACFNGIYEACGNPGSFTDSDGEVRMKCANSATTNCPFNYNSYIKVNEEGEVVLNDRSTGNSTISSSAACFGYTTTTTTSTGSRSTTTTSTDPYVSLRGPVADARRSIMQKYLLDANSACDVYGTALKSTAQNINYQKIAAEQALQQKRLEFKQEEEERVFSEARSAIDNFNECISEIWDCYRDYEEEDKWTSARIKAYCTQVSQVPHCYETMICAPVQSQLVAVVDVPDRTNCSMVNDKNEYIYSGENACRNVVTISEILYGTGAATEAVVNLTEYMKGTNTTTKITNLNSAGVREGCLQMALGCEAGSSDSTCLRNWQKTSGND